MPWLLPRPLPDAAADAFERYLQDLAARLDDPATDRNALVRSLLAEWVYGRPFEELQRNAPWAAFALDPAHATFEAEHYAATDIARFRAVKPLLWLWRNLDGTPLGQSLATGIPLRRMLAERIFARAGRNLKIFPGVEVSVGYNIEVGDDVVVHRHVFLDDIGGLEIHDGASLADYASVFSHTHDVHEQADVTLRKTVIGANARVAFHATVLAGAVLSDDSMIGAHALATRSVQPHVVALGLPARPRMWKERDGDARFARLQVDAEAYPDDPGRPGNPDYAQREDE